MLIYNGGGYGGSLPLIPARNLTDEEVERLGGEKALLATGLYERPAKEAPKKGKAIDKEEVTDGNSRS